MHARRPLHSLSLRHPCGGRHRGERRPSERRTAVVRGALGPKVVRTGPDSSATAPPALDRSAGRPAVGATGVNDATSRASHRRGWYPLERESVQPDDLRAMPRPDCRDLGNARSRVAAIRARLTSDAQVLPTRETFGPSAAGGSPAKRPRQVKYGFTEGWTSGVELEDGIESGGLDAAPYGVSPRRGTSRSGELP